MEPIQFAMRHGLEIEEQADYKHIVERMFAGDMTTVSVYLEKRGLDTNCNAYVVACKYAENELHEQRELLKGNGS